MNGCDRQIQTLESYLYECIHNDKLGVQLQSIPSGRKRVDLYIPAFKLMIALIGHHHKLSKSQQDELVIAFHDGLLRWPGTVRHCLHGLTVSVYELPGSVSRFLPSILQKMAQIISSGYAAPILEFLSTLAQNSKLYSSFVERDYKTVFGIALKYVQDGSSTESSSITRSRSSGDVIDHELSSKLKLSGISGGHYIVHLAYHVIAIWFMSLRLSDRRRYVPIIIHHLLSNKKDFPLEENAELVLDMLIQNTYCDSAPKLPRPSQIPKDERRLTKTWLKGNSLLTLRTLPEPGWLEAVSRRCSGTQSFKIKLDYGLPNRNMKSNNFDLGTQYMLPSIFCFKKKVFLSCYTRVSCYF